MITIPYYLSGNASAAGTIMSVQAVANGPIIGFSMGSSVSPGATAIVNANTTLTFLASTPGDGTESRSVIGRLNVVFSYFATPANQANQGAVSNLFFTGLMIPWALGERLYLNLGYITGSGQAVYAQAIVHQAVDDKDYQRMSGRFG